MKKLILLYTFCLVFVFSSCNHRSGITLEKRHYTKGYYLAHGNRASTPVAALPEKRKKNIPEGKAVQEMVALPEVIPHSDPSFITAAPGNAEIKNTVYASRNKNTGRIYSAPTKTSIRYLPLKLKHSPAGLKSASGVPDADEALSLIWILVLIVLAIWLLAFLTGGWGLGGFVHLFLVVAVVLFVLWLLKII